MNNNLKQLKEDYKKLGETIAELEKKTQHKPSEGFFGWYIKDCGIIDEDDSVEDAMISHDINNWFATKEEAKKELAKRQAIVRVKEFIIDNGLYFKPNYNNQDQTQYGFFYDISERGIRIECYGTAISYSPIGYLKSEEDAEEVLEDCKEDLELIYKP